MYTGMLSKRVPNHSSYHVGVKNASFPVNTVATRSVSMVNCTVSPNNRSLKLARSFEQNACLK